MVYGLTILATRRAGGGGWPGQGRRRRVWPCPWRSWHKIIGSGPLKACIYTVKNIYICEYIHTYVHAHTHTHTHTYIYIHMYTHTHTHIYIYIYICAHICTVHMYAYSCTNVDKYMCMYVVQCNAMQCTALSCNVMQCNVMYCNVCM